MNIINKVEKILLNGGIEEYKAEAKLIVLELSNLKLEDIILGANPKNEDEILSLALNRVKTKAPLQHLLGSAYFMGEKYLVNENVLIPRDETQILVEKAYELLKDKKDKIDILDIGIGSGCISCALAKKLKEKDIEILGVDVSFEALETAIENINKLNLVRKVLVRKSDLFSKIRLIEKFDLIISNPPYIPISEKNNLQNEVVNFEPHLALFASDDKGVEFYKKIIETAPKFLKEGGYLAFELGINQSKEVKTILKDDFREIEIIKDLSGIDRVISAKLS